jgi:hypothetical protein
MRKMKGIKLRACRLLAAAALSSLPGKTFELFFKFFFFAAIVLYLSFCAPEKPEKIENPPPPETEETETETAIPFALLQTGRFPIWFQLTEDGPVHIEAIEDACYSSALIPWPLTIHFRFALADDKGLVFAINGDGFMQVLPWRENSEILALYRYPGPWRQYTVGASFFYDKKPAALLYRDDRFYSSGNPLPANRTWTFTPDAGIFALDIPVLEQYPSGEGWDADSLMHKDSYWYYRVVKKQGPRPEILMLRTASLEQGGEKISVAAFQNSAMPEPLNSAPPLLREFLKTAFEITGSGTALALSPEFPLPRYFSINNSESEGLYVYYSEKEAIAAAILPSGEGVYREFSPGAQGAPGALSAPGAPGEPDADKEMQFFSLPELPGGFCYTWFGITGENLFACWEEQQEYSTGAAGFMAYRYKENK